VRLTHGASIVRVTHDYGLTVLDSIVDRDIYEVLVLNQEAIYATELFLKFDSRVRYSEEEASIASPELQADPFHLAFDISADSTAYQNQTAYQQTDLVTGSGNSGSSGAANSTVAVAVLDTGVDPTHPNLAGRLLAGYNTLTPGFAPLDIPDGQSNTVVGHGTMIAGLIARAAPDSMIMPVRVLNADGIGTIMHVMEGIHYAVRQGVGVINMSFETNRSSIALADAIDEAYNAGIVLVASAGNDSTSSPRYPAAYSNVIGVASVEADNTLSPFSNYGVNASVVAPGSSIRSLYWDGSFASWSGTSFAAPFATAEAAEIVAGNQNLTPAQVTYIMLNTANSVDYLNPGYANMLGAGIIDFQAATGGQ
jgi:subtilisin family serine protease